MDVLINDDAFGRRTLLLCLLDLVVDLRLVELGHLCMQSFDHFFLQFVGAQGDAELVLRTINHVGKRLLDVIVDIVHAEIEMLDLRILYGHPFLDLLTLLVDPFDWFNIVELRYRLLRFLRRLLFLVGLDDGIARLQLLQVVLHLV